MANIDSSLEAFYGKGGGHERAWAETASGRAGGSRRTQTGTGEVANESSVMPASQHRTTESFE
jgi:hypothetical protein